MNIIATRTIGQYQQDYPDAASALDTWYDKATWKRDCER